MMTTRKTDELASLYKQFAQSQHRQQLAMMLILTAVVAIATGTYTWITLKSIAVTREANELQRQALAPRETSHPPKVATTGHADTRPMLHAGAQAPAKPSRRQPATQEPAGGRQEVVDTPPVSATVASSSAPNPRSWSARSSLLDRPGRQ